MAEEARSLRCTEQGDELSEQAERRRFLADLQRAPVRAVLACRFESALRVHTHNELPDRLDRSRGEDSNHSRHEVRRAEWALHVPVLEYCLQEERNEKILDGITGKDAPQLKKYLSLTATEVTGQLTDEVGSEAILIPPQARISAIMRDSLSKMITGIQADTILQEEVEVSRVDLYYRPVYAFKYAWASKQKEAILEVDGLTGEFRSGTRVFTEYLGKALDQAFLFDIGADAIGMFVPGGGIAVKAAKKYIDTRPR